MSEATDPLNLDVNLDDVDTSRPVLPKATYSMVVHKVEVSENKAKSGRNLIVDFATTQPHQSTKDVNINPGFTVRSYYPLQASEKHPESDLWKQQLARLQDAVTGTEQGARGAFNPHEFTGQAVLLTLDIETSEEFGEQNRIRKVMRLEEE
jgi:hypothetical protein